MSDPSHDQSDGSPGARTGGRFALPILLAVALCARAAVALYFSPQSDVYYYLTQAVQTLLRGMSPYVHAYLGVPPALVTPGAENVLAYLPFGVLYLVPFFLAGDVRLGFLAADLVIGYSLYRHATRWRVETALVYLFLPFTIVLSTFYLNEALLAMAFLAVFVLLESSGKGVLGALSLGLALASSQFVLVLLPMAVFYFVRRGRWREPLVALAAAALVVAPFFLASPSQFTGQTLSFEFSRAVSPLFSSSAPLGSAFNPSLSAVVYSATGAALPTYVKALAEVGLVAVLLRADDLRTLMKNGAILVIASAFVLPNDFFWAYLELPFMLLLFWASSARRRADGDGRTAPKI